MNNYLKDNIQKPTLFSQAENDFLFFVQHAKKIGTAIYLVSKLVEDEHLRVSIRESSLKLLHHLLSYLKDKRRESIIKAHHELYGTMSFMDIMHQSGYVSDMNHRIVSNELVSFQKKIFDFFHTHHREKGINISDLFSSTEEKKASEELHKHSPIEIKKESISSSEFTPNQEKISLQKKSIQSKKLSPKEKRHKNILDILKQKKDASVNDICSLFKDCSAKTIQRDLKELIEKKKVVKRGDRRWATYNLK